MKQFDEEKLRAEYTPKTKTGLDEAIKLDKKVKLPPLINSLVLGIIGTLLLGVGMCLAMSVIGGGTTLMMTLGVIVGILGIVLVSSNYPIYTRFLKLRKEKYSSAIILALNKENK